MDSTAIDLVGAGALLLWGMRMIRTGVSRAFGARLRLWLAAGTRNRVTAFLVGLAATCALQSSTATVLMTASFAARALISGAMALAVMLGADVGTSLVAYALGFDMHWLSPALIALGTALFMANGASRPRAIGRALIGVGLLLLSLRLMAGATEPLRQSVVMQNLLSALGAAPVIGTVVTAGLTLLTSSSLAVVLLVAALSAKGGMSVELVIAMVLGANIGGAFVPILATYGNGPAARRAPFGNLAFKLAGGLALFAFLGQAAQALTGFGVAIDDAAVVTHLAFNLALAAAFLPLVGVATAGLERFLPSAGAAATGPRYLDPDALEIPTVALACAARETLRVGDRVEEMLMLCRNAMESSDLQACTAIRAIDDEVDRVQEAVTLYVSRLRREGELDETEEARATEILSFVVNLEHIGDIIDKSMRALVEKKISNRLAFSAEGFAEIRDLHERTIRNLRTAESVFAERDEELARHLVSMKVDIRRFERLSTDNHLERLREGRIESVETSSLHLDFLRDLKRVNAHLASVAYPMLEETGALRESRLVAPV